MSDSPEIQEVAELRALLKEAKDILTNIVCGIEAMPEAVAFVKKLEGK